jgi:uncharacterized phage protein gp47/JayE
VPDVVDQFGLQVASLDELRELTRDDIRASPQFSSDADVGPDTVLAQIVDPVLFRLSEARQMLRSAYDATDPDNAEGVQADSVSALSGIQREPATKSRGTVELAGTPSTPIPAGHLVKLPNVDGSNAELLEAVVIGGGGTVDGEYEAVETGAINYPDTTVLTIVTPIGGLTSATVKEPVSGGFSLGRDIETDGAMKIRRNASLSAGGNGTVLSIAAQIAQLTDVQHAVVLENTTGSVDAKGLPPNSMRPVIWPSTIDIEQLGGVLYATWPGGTTPDGAISLLVTNIKGQEFIFKYSVATDRDVWIVVDLTPGPDYGGDDAVKAAVVTYGGALLPGDDVDPGDIICAIKDNVAGVIDPKIKLGFAAAPTNEDLLVVDVDEIAIIETARITVNS